MLAFGASSASAYEVKVYITGYGNVDETTPANKINCNSSPAASDWSRQYICSGGTPAGEYSYGWTVSLAANVLGAEDGWSFVGWRGVPQHTSGGATYKPVDCDGAENAQGINTSETCQFGTIDNLAVEAVFDDSVGPDTSVTGGPSGTVSSADANFGFSADQAGSSFQCRVVGGTFFSPCNASIASNSSVTTASKSFVNLPDGPREFEVYATDASGNPDPVAADRLWTIAAPPSAPPGLTAPSANESAISLDWGSSSDNSGVAGYEVFRNGTSLGTVTETTKTVFGLSCGTSYNFGVEAYDWSGNRSGRTSINASTSGCAPPAPTDGDGDGVVDSSDGCPSQAGPASNNGCPAGGSNDTNDDVPPPANASEFARTLNLSYSEKKDRFGGKLSSESPACTAGQSVTVYEQKKGKDPKLGTVTTNDAGKYSLKEKNAEGSFYASVKESSASAGTCLAAQSKTVNVG